MPIPDDCLTREASASRPLHLLGEEEVAPWLAERPEPWRRWLEASGFEAKPGATTLLPGEDGGVAAALHVRAESPGLWDVAAARDGLKGGTWRLEGDRIDPHEAALAWQLASYRFDRYKAAPKGGPVLAVEDEPRRGLAGAIAFGRDLVNTPAFDLGPEELTEAIAERVRAHGAKARTIVGDELLEQNWPAIHTVGRAAARAPRLLDVTWGDESAPKLTLVGKGVCFDTGGLDIKSAGNMALMKKDMGGSAAMAALAVAVMDANLPVRLRLLVPAVENSIGGDSYRPGDVIATRKGLRVEIGNTDAEGRLILADALHEAALEEPDLLVDAATLTGAARVALGPELPALFTPQDDLAQALLARGVEAHEPLWRLPLHQPYKGYIKSPIADLNNSGSKPFAGAVTAALFLQAFAGAGNWLHLDVFGWNDEARPGRPKGGEAVAVRPLLALFEARYRR